MRQLVAEETLAEYLGSIKSSEVCKGGILIGTKPETGKQTLLRLAQSPDQKGKKWTSINSVEPSWLAGHALQATNLLPGGLDVIGMFIIAPDDAQKECINVLKQALVKFFKIHKKSNIQLLHGMEECQLLAVHVSSVSGSILACKQFNIVDYKDAGSHVDWKYQQKLPQPLNSITLYFDFNFKSVMNVSNNSKFLECFYRIIQSQLEKFKDIYLEQDGEIKALTEPFEKNLESNKKQPKGKKQSQKPPQKSKSYNCDLLMQYAEVRDEKSDCIEEKVTHWITCNGKMMATCYFFGNCTCENIIKHLTDDIVRSLRQRIELVQDDIAEGSPKVIFPKRVSCKHVEDYIQYSEYLIEGEHMDDCADRIKDVLDMKSEVQECGEKVPILKSASKPQKHAIQEPETPPPVVEEPKTDSTNMATKVAACTAFVIGLIAWVYSTTQV